MIRRLSVAVSLLLALCLAVPAGARPDADSPVGSYELSGQNESGESYAGSARIGRADDHLVVTFDREGERPRSGRLERSDEGWTYRILLEGRGVVGALVGAVRTPTMLRGALTPADDGFEASWDVVHGDEVLDSGTATLVRRAEDEARGRVRLAVSVDWEGDDLLERNIAAMESFREALPDVPLTQFINAAYYTKDDADPARVTRRIRRTLRPIDETGLHVHCWRSLVEAAGVEFRREPTFWGRPARSRGDDMGHEVELPAYEVDEIRAIVRHSVEVLSANGFSVSDSFRAGGWMAPPPVLEAIRAEGFRVDSSATDPTWHDELSGVRLRDRIGEVWDGVTEETAPWTIETPAGPILEIPDTGALADYITADEMAGHLRAAAARLEETPDRDVYVHVGFHQETAARYADRVREAIETIRTEGEVPLVVETLAAQARRIRANRDGATSGDDAGEADGAVRPDPDGLTLPADPTR